MLEELTSGAAVLCNFKVLVITLGCQSKNVNENSSIHSHGSHLLSFVIRSLTQCAWLDTQGWLVSLLQFDENR